MQQHSYSDISSISTTKLDRDTEAVKNAIKNIIMTPIGSMPGKPLFGSNISKYVFENITPGLKIVIQQEVTMAIDNWEPRADVTTVYVEEYPEYNRVVIHIGFKLVKDPLQQLHDLSINVT